MKARPNIVIFNPDEFRADSLGHISGDKDITPVMDELVRKDSVSFENAFCQNPVCTPSRCSFMSGWYPHVRGHRTMNHMMEKDEPVLLKILKDSGYFVWWGGKNDLIPGENGYGDYCDVKHIEPNDLAPNLHSFNSWRGNRDGEDFYSFLGGKLETEDNTKYYDSDWFHVEGAVNCIKEYSNDNPFCIYLPLNYPHPPYAVEEPWYSLVERDKVKKRIKDIENWETKPSILKGIYEGQKLQTWSEEKWKELRAVYIGMCARLDYQLGLIIEALKNKGIYDNTIIFIFSDHGDYAGDYGLVEKNQNTFEDCLTNVPFIIKPPSNIPIKPGIRETLVELTDFTATVSDICDIELKYTNFGKSLVPLFLDENKKHRDAVFSEGGRLHGEVHCMEKNSIVENGLYNPRLRMQSKENAEHTKAVMCRTEKYKYVHRLYEKDEFYDLEKDPEELVNQIDNLKYKEKIDFHKQRIMKFYLETTDVVPYKLHKREFED